MIVNSALPNSVQEFIEIQACLLLNFFLCLHNQLVSVHSIVTHQRAPMFEKCNSSNRQKRMVASLSISARFTAKFKLVIVVLKPTERVLVPLKTVLEILKRTLRLREWYDFVWKSLEILNGFNTLKELRNHILCFIHAWLLFR